MSNHRPRYRSAPISPATHGAFESLESRRLFSGGALAEYAAARVAGHSAIVASREGGRDDDRGGAQGRGHGNTLVFNGTPGSDTFRLAGDVLHVNGRSYSVRNAKGVTLVGKAGDDSYLLDRAMGITIVDTGGTDTLDFSSASRGVEVDLARGPGDRGDKGRRGDDDDEDDRGHGNGAALHAPLAFDGTVENVIGSRYDDRISGNAAPNVLDGNLGNDSLTGRAGADTFVLTAGQGTDAVRDFQDGVDKLKLAGGLAWVDLAVTQVGNDTVVSVAQPTLVGFASLPAQTFGRGPTSGQFITGANGVTPPFEDQPVQGFSAVRRNGDGTYWAMSDNGYGAKNNSADFLLRLHRIHPDFRTSQGGTAGVRVLDQITLSDPNRKIPFPIVADVQFYPNAVPNNPDAKIPVDPSIKSGRLLTGADFDIESFRVAPDGTFWFGDEFGPFLIHTDSRGRMLDAPIELPGVRSPDSPYLGTGTANLPRSRGFEGMALNTSGTKLYPSLEGALTTDADQRRRIVYEFDLATKRYTANQWSYRMEDPGHAIGDLTAVNDREMLIIERDNNQGAAAAFKKIFLVNLDQVGPDGYLVKRELVDLLNVADPNDLDRNGSPKFTFPFQTIEDVEVIDPWTIGVLDDNNFPFSNGRTPGQPDNNEFILIGLSQPLAVPGRATLPTQRGSSSMVLKGFSASDLTIADTQSTAPRPLVIGHRGASGHRPEHTLEAYALAIEQGADFIEPDLVITSDGVLIARHEPVLAQVNPTTGAIIERTTNVNEKPEFAARLTTKNLDGVQVTGWFAEDLTLAEVKTLRAVERLPFRNHAFDGQFQIPTFQEVVDLAQARSAALGRTVGIYPETKHPTYFDQMGKSLEEPLVSILRAEDLDDADDAVFIQSFEVSNLRELNTMVETPIVQLLNAGGKPYDFVANNDARTYADLATPAGLAFIATYADGVGANKRLIVPATATELLPPTTLIRDAHAAGLLVHAWTFRNESPQFLHPAYGGDPVKEYEQFFALGLDGLFSDFPGAAAAVARRLYPFTPPDFRGGVGLID